MKNIQNETLMWYFKLMDFFTALKEQYFCTIVLTLAVPSRIIQRLASQPFHHCSVRIIISPSLYSSPNPLALLSKLGVHRIFSPPSLSRFIAPPRKRSSYRSTDARSVYISVECSWKSRKKECGPTWVQKEDKIKENIKQKRGESNKVEDKRKVRTKNRTKKLEKEDIR